MTFLEQLWNDKEFILRRIAQQCFYIIDTFSRFDKGLINEKRCRECVDSAVDVRERLNKRLLEIETDESRKQWFLDFPIQVKREHKFIITNSGVA